MRQNTKPEATSGSSLWFYFSTQDKVEIYTLYIYKSIITIIQALGDKGVISRNCMCTDMVEYNMD